MYKHSQNLLSQNDTADQETKGIPNCIIIVVGIAILAGAASVVYKKQKS